MMESVFADPNRIRKYQSLPALALTMVMVLLCLCAVPVGGTAGNKISEAFSGKMDLSDDGTYLYEWEESVTILVGSEDYTLSIAYDPDKNEMLLDAYKKPYSAYSSIWHYTLGFVPESDKNWTFQYYRDNLKDLNSAEFNPRTLIPDTSLGFSGKGAEGTSIAAQIILQTWLAKLKSQFNLTPADLGLSVYEGYENDGPEEEDDPDPEIDPDPEVIPDTATESAANVIRYVLSHRQTDDQGRSCMTEQISVGKMFSDQITCRITYDTEAQKLIFTGEWKMHTGQSNPYCVYMEYDAASGAIKGFEYRAGDTITASVGKDYKVGDDLFFLDKDGNLSGFSSAAQGLTEHVVKTWNKMLGKNGYGLADLGFTGFSNENNTGSRDYEETALITFLRENGKQTRYTKSDVVYYTATAEFVDDTDYDNEDKIVLRCNEDKDGNLVYVLTYDCRTGIADNLRFERNLLGDVQRYDKPIDQATFTKDTDLVFHVIWGTGLSADYTGWREAMQYFDELLHACGFSLGDLGFHAYERSLHGEENVPGWLNENGRWYYILESGAAYNGGWLDIGGIWYYFRPGGEMATGWVNDQGVWYFMEDTGIMKTGWMQSGDDWYLFTPGGAMAIGWIYDSGAWYCFSDSGVMRTGWVQSGNDWYLLSSSGSMVTGWVNDGGSWYYFNQSGVMVTGWQSIGGLWYYFHDSGAMATGWLEDKATAVWYWFDDSGVMASGWKEINGRWEMFSESGAWLYTWEGN